MAAHKTDIIKAFDPDIKTTADEIVKFLPILASEDNGVIKAANEKKIFMSKVRLEETLLHIMDTEETPKFTIDNIVKTSKKIFDRGLGHKTVAKYLNEIKNDLCIN